MTCKAIIIIATLIAPAICAPAEVKGNDRTTNTIRSPANLSYQELNYLLKARSGIDTSNINPIYLTPCAKAILSCCKENIMNSDCSESLKCGAHFFDSNPCDVKFIRSALDAASEFYDQFFDKKT